MCSLLLAAMSYDSNVATHFFKTFHVLKLMVKLQVCMQLFMVPFERVLHLEVFGQVLAFPFEF